MGNTPAARSATKIVLKGTTCNEEPWPPFTFPRMGRLHVKESMSRVIVYANYEVGVEMERAPHMRSALSAKAIQASRPL